MARVDLTGITPVKKKIDLTGITLIKKVDLAGITPVQAERPKLIEERPIPSPYARPLPSEAILDPSLLDVTPKSVLGLRPSGREAVKAPVGVPSPTVAPKRDLPSPYQRPLPSEAVLAPELLKAEPKTTLGFKKPKVTLGQFVKAGVTGLGSGGAILIDTLEKAQRIGEQAPLAPDVSPELKEKMEMLKPKRFSKEFKKARAKLKPRENATRAERIAFQAGEMFGQVVVGSMTGTPLWALSISSGVGKMDEVLNAGGSYWKALGAGTAQTLTEYVTEKFTLGELEKILKGKTKQQATAFLKSYFKANVYDAFGEVLSNGIERGVIDPAFLDKKAPEMNQLFNESIDIAIASFLATSGLAVSAKAISRAPIDMSGIPPSGLPPAALPLVAPIQPTAPEIAPPTPPTREPVRIVDGKPPEISREQIAAEDAAILQDAESQLVSVKDKLSRLGDTAEDAFKAKHLNSQRRFLEKNVAGLTEVAAQETVSRPVVEPTKVPVEAIAPTVLEAPVKIKSKNTLHPEMKAILKSRGDLRESDLAPDIYAVDAVVPGKPITLDGYRGAGRADKVSIYAEGVTEPVFGEGKYMAIDKESAAKYGVDIKKEKVILNNPLLITSDKEFANFIGVNFIPLDNESRIPLLRKARLKMEARGHDGVVINVPKHVDMNVVGDSVKRIREIFGETQIFVLPKVQPPTIPKAPTAAESVVTGELPMLREGERGAITAYTPKPPATFGPTQELVTEIDKTTPKPDLTGETLEPVDLPDSFENDRAPMDLTDSGKRERAKQEVFDKPAVKAETDRTYKQLVKDGLITELTNKDIGNIEKEIMFPHTIAKKFPKFRPIYEIALDMEARTDSRISNYSKILEPYLNLKNKKNLDAFMIEEDVERGGRFSSAQERMARLTPEENAAWESFRATTKETKNDLGDLLIELGNDPDKVTRFINKLPDTYVPLSRFGDYQVYVEDRAGNEISYTFHKTKREAQVEAKKWAGKGKIKIGKIKKTSDELLNDIPINVLAGLKAFDKELNTDFTKAYGSIMGKGFPSHLLERRMVKGFETDLTKPISNYLLSIGKYIERKRARPKLESALANIDPKTESNLFTAGSKYAKYMTSHTNELSKFRQWMFRYYLGGNIKSALLNATQTFTTTVPSFSKYTGNSAVKVAKASNIARQSLENIRKKDADLAGALEQAIYDGIISEQFVTMLRGGAYQSLNLNRVDKALSFFFNHVEVFNRKVAFIAAYKTATSEGVRIKDVDGKKRKVKLSREEAIRFAEDFVNETQFNYTKADRPAITRGLRAPFFTFRMFTGNYLSMLKNFVTDKEFAALAKALGAAVALGGVKAFPGARDLIKVLESLGHDPEKELREATGKYGDLLLHGALFPTGVDISGAVNTLEIVPRDAQQGAWPAIANIVLGVPTDLPKRINKAIFFAHDLKDPWRAVEAVMPEAVRNPMVAVRWVREGAARTAFGEPIAKPGLGSILLKAASVQPSILTKAYEREHSEKLLSERSREVSRNISFMIARAIFNKDEKGLSKIYLDISKHNENVKDPSELIIVNKRSVKEALANMIYPEAVELRRMPKKARPAFMAIQETFKEKQ